MTVEYARGTNNHDLPMSAVAAVGLTKSFGKKPAIDSLDFVFLPIGITGLIGRNGAGKTTLLKLCAGLTPKSSGSLEVWGQTPLNNLEVLSKLIYSYHDVRYSSGLKCKTILTDYQTMFPNFSIDFALGLLDYFDIDAKKRYSRLSQGTKSTFNFICALAARTPLTMLDEPTLGMDVTVRKAVYEVLVREYAENPRAFVISSHLMSEIENFLDDVLIIDQGKLVLHDSIENMRQSAYRLQGSREILESFCTGKRVLYKEHAETKSLAVIHEAADERVLREAQELGLNLSAVRPEDLYVYLTQEYKGGDLESLWSGQSDSGQVSDPSQEQR
ncbi:MAG: ABC transporter ATP-binding protein [Coriobacteriia bacterium]|nr:ABC transporter ATP-binding protein [Coriobacteriia bacterium]